MKLLGYSLLWFLAANSYLAWGELYYPYSYGEFVELDHNLSLAPPARPSGPPFDSVVAKYGPAVVAEGFFEAQSTITPWSSYWYPKSEKTLFDETASPGTSTLGRYDKYVTKRGSGSLGSAREYEEKVLYSGSNANWEGLCDALAMAAIMEKEPVREVTLKGVTFRIQDLKALLIKTYEGSYYKDIYGQRNNAVWDSVYEDVYPEQFHRFIQAEIFEKKRPFIMDMDAGYQIWNVPVYKIQTKIVKDATDPEIVHVKTWAHFASPFVNDLNYVGTMDTTKSYSYDLHGKILENGGFLVDYGVWTENSRWDHPDYLVARPETSDRKVKNIKLDISIIDEIVKTSQ